MHPVRLFISLRNKDIVFHACSEGRNLAEILNTKGPSRSEGQLRTGLSVKLNVFHNSNSGGSQMNNPHAYPGMSLLLPLETKSRAIEQDLHPRLQVTVLRIRSCVPIFRTCKPVG